MKPLLRHVEILTPFYCGSANSNIRTAAAPGTEVTALGIRNDTQEMNNCKHAKIKLFGCNENVFQSLQDLSVSTEYPTVEKCGHWSNIQLNVRETVYSFQAYTVINY
jgi:hypothetical protein